MPAGDGHPASAVPLFTLSRVCPWSFPPPPNWLSVTAPPCPEVFIVWRCTLGLPLSSQMFHCGRSICHCQRCQAVVTMVTVWGLKVLEVWAPPPPPPGGTADLTTRICRAPCTFFARSVTASWQMSKKCGTDLISAQQCMLGYNW